MMKKRDTLLVVDDDEVVLKLFDGLSKRYGVSNEIHKTAASAISSFSRRKIPYRGAVIDLFLPDVSGAGLAQLLREKWPDMPICICTGLDDPHNVRIAKRLGWYLKKPFWTADGLRILQRILGSTA